MNTLEQLWPVWKCTRSRHRDTDPGFPQRRARLEADRDLSTNPQLFKSFRCLQPPNQWSFPPPLLYSPSSPTTVAHRTNLIGLGFYFCIHRVIGVTTPFFLTAEQVFPLISKGQGQSGNTRRKKSPENVFRSLVQQGQDISGCTGSLNLPCSDNNTLTLMQK